ncbi:MAG TPA: ABC transporter permease subunit [Vicinamibacterales bacterium]|jgi:ABC-type transport system involved in multi-copper enzyme maturation permease subunit|nr:ABC transporter permease subunit [Vicinamibacterales bacterium]
MTTRAALPAPPTFATGAVRVFSLSLGEMLWSRRTIFLVLVTGAPVFLALVARIVQGSGVVPLRVNGVPVDGASIFGMMIWVFFLRFIVPVLGVFYGTALMADEVEDRTITYLFTRPIRRGAVLVGKYLAYVVCTTLVVLPSVVLVYFVLVPFSQVARSFVSFAIDLGLLALGLAAYGAVFALVGAALKRPLVSGLLFVFGWEQVALLVPGYFRRLTVAHYVQSLVPHAMPSSGVASLLQSVLSDKPPALVCLLALAAIITGTLWLAARTVESREYVLDQ